MHVRPMGINFHEIVLPRKKVKISTPHKKPAIMVCGTGDYSRWPLDWNARADI